MTIADQPPPVAQPQRQPAWDIVIEHTLLRHSATVTLSHGGNVVALVVADMRTRHRLGVERYGMPLTAGNGRDHLVDAYQEKLDAAAYLANELDERGIGPEMYPDASKWDRRLASEIKTVQRLLDETIDHIIRLRTLIAERVR